MRDITAWLKSQDVKFTANRTVHTAEQITLELLPKLQSMNDGAIGVVETGGCLAVLHMIASQSAPVDEEKATPRKSAIPDQPALERSHCKGHEAIKR